MLAAFLTHERRARLEETRTPHILRHTFAKNLVDAEVSLDRVAALLGHENLNMSMFGRECTSRIRL